MKVTREMVHPDLRGRFGMLAAFTALMRREWVLRLFARLGRLSNGNDIEGIDCSERFIDGGDGQGEIRTRIYRPAAGGEAPERLPGVLYIHGGGYMLGNPESSHAFIERFIQTRPCVVVAPDYRKAFTAPYPAGLDDCYATLLWMRTHAQALGIRDDAFIVAGHSAGGGLTAAVTLKARDTGDVRIAFQMPIYPMIDDTQPDDPERAMSSPVWDTDLNRLGWAAYLADLRRDGVEIPAYAAPARNRDYEGFPPTITFVGDMEPFHRETLDYVAALQEAGVEVAFREFPGCFHAFDFLGDGIGVEAQDFTFDAFADFHDRHLPAGAG